MLHIQEVVRFCTKHLSRGSYHSSTNKILRATQSTRSSKRMKDSLYDKLIAHFLKFDSGKTQQKQLTGFSKAFTSLSVLSITYLRKLFIILPKHI